MCLLSQRERGLETSITNSMKVKLDQRGNSRPKFQEMSLCVYQLGEGCCVFVDVNKSIPRRKERTHSSRQEC
jgi:hypothetical protein